MVNTTVNGKLPLAIGDKQWTCEKHVLKSCTYTFWKKRKLCDNLDNSNKQSWICSSQPHISIQLNLLKLIPSLWLMNHFLSKICLICKHAEQQPKSDRRLINHECLFQGCNACLIARVHVSQILASSMHFTPEPTKS